MSEGIQGGNVSAEGVITQSITPAQVATIVTVEQTFTVPGLKVGDFVAVSAPGIQAGAAITGARVSAADTLAITFTNPTAGNVTPLTGDHLIHYVRPGLTLSAVSD